MLALLQNDLGLVDPLNYAGALVTNPLATADQKHVFQPYGQGDTYAPPVTRADVRLAAQLGQVDAAERGDGGPLQLGAPSCRRRRAATRR